MPINGTFTTFDLQRGYKAIAYIDQHYRDKIPPEWLSVDININVKLLQKVFQHLTGLSIHAYQNKVRIEHALEELLDYSKPIKAIAFKNGYKSVTQFGRQFRKQNGVSPQDYRLRLLQDGFLFNESIMVVGHDAINGMNPMNGNTRAEKGDIFP
ncbi:MAG: hypothetical protein BGO55_23540 [Sphingobacteriales bacterium 50-39]|nr:MAG: hypothetical protein BGO55_23540 [Sphingobacteriales bacterium 50-39]